MTNNPKIFLAIDNCFAYKRWTRPQDWARVISDLGIKFIEASADTELDPLYMGRDYLKRWTLDVREAQERYDVKVANLYSGHGTYCTLGLTHTDESVRNRIVEEWFFPMIDVAAHLGAGLGFYAHGFADHILQDKRAYIDSYGILVEQLCRITRYGNQKGLSLLSLEQMYAPHMIPWTIGGTIELMRQVTAQSESPLYFTEDVGHHDPRFIAPSVDILHEHYQRGDSEGLWLGHEDAYQAFSRGDLDEVTRLIQEYNYLFSGTRDCSCYEWISQIGKYSPIMHLQQTDGLSSRHLPFTAKTPGIISAEKILKALQQSYNSNLSIEGIPECTKIYLTLEVFSGTTDIQRDLITRYKETVKYWRKYVPKDGILLSDALALCGA